MLEFNNWFFVLVVNFLVLLFVLNRILFRPLLRVFKEREDTVSGALEAARAMQLKREELEETLKREFAEAAMKAKERYGALREEGISAQRQTMERTGAEAAGIMEKAREALRAETEKARQSLRADVDKFSEDIVEKLVKV